MPVPFFSCRGCQGIRILFFIWAIFLIGLGSAACNAIPATPRATAAPSLEATLPPATFTPRPTPTPSATPLVPHALLLAPQGAPASLIEAASVALSNLSARSGVIWEMRQSLTAADLTPEVRLVIALPPTTGLEALAKAAPGVQFLAVGISGLSSLPNLSRIGPEGGSQEEAAFMAGVVAAIITDEWRVGVLSLSDTQEGITTRQAFLNGAVFFCGLCRQVYPPYYRYPLYVEFPSNASQAEKQAAIDALVDRYVKTVYLAPGANDAALIQALDEAGIGIISSISPEPPLPDRWVVTIRADPTEAIARLLPDLMQGSGGIILPMPLEMTDINPNLFSPGRQALAQKYLAELMLGVIATDDLLE